jgi:hypothetical protein
VASPIIDRRREPRLPVLQIGMILADPGAAPRYCLILDRSNSGVRLRTTSDFQAPSEFFLRCMDTESKYKVVWRRGSSRRDGHPLKMHERRLVLWSRRGFSGKSTIEETPEHA